jgi:hypothetical protein
MFQILCRHQNDEVTIKEVTRLMNRRGAGQRECATLSSERGNGASRSVSGQSAGVNMI